MTLEHEASRMHGARLIDRLAARARQAGGEAVTPGDPRYETARRVYNRLHDPRPRALIRTLDADLLFEIATECGARGLPLAVRGGGHHIGGGSGGGGGVVLDFSSFRDVEYCPETRTCRVQPGARLSDVDRELGRHGRVIPTGTVSDTGIAGLTLGGGIGWLVGPLGLACDHLAGADVLLADGRVVRAEEGDPEDLLWALRGGGGAGVVLEFRFRTAALPPTTTGSVLVRRNVAPTLAALLEHLAERCPRGLTVAPVLGRTGDGGALLRVEYCSAGPNAPGVADLLDLLAAGIHTPFNGSFLQWQAHLDPEFLPPQRGYWKACHLEGIAPTEVAAMVDAVSNAPTDRCSILIEHLHGAFGEVGEGTSAFPLRRARFGVLFAARWPDGKADEENIAWAREGYSRLDPTGRRPVYANYASAQDTRAAAAFSTETQDRLRSLRDEHDFRGLSHRPGAAVPIHPFGART